MKPTYKFIFDLDGTLYRFDGSADSAFTSSRFYADIKENVYNFLMKKLRIPRPAAQAEYARLKEKYQGEVSLAVEKEYGIDRYEYFGQTWNLLPKDYLQPNKELRDELVQFTRKAALLSAAPKIWVDAVLKYLGIEQTFGERVFTGEPNLRKPNPEVFTQVAQTFGVGPELIFSIGDQEYSDILPAQKLGMKTILIGKPQKSQPDFAVPDVLTAITLLKQKGVL